MDKTKKTFAELRRIARETAPMRWSRRGLAQILLFKGAHQESIAPLLRDCPVRVLASGEVLLLAGEPCESVFIVLSGSLCEEGPSAALPGTIFSAGDSIGKSILREKVVFKSAISAMEPTRLLVIDRETGWSLVRKSREIAHNWRSPRAGRKHVGGESPAGEASQISDVDHVTQDEYLGLRQRHWLDSTLPRQLARSAVAKEPLALLLVEIDGFADYAAQFGKTAGDRAYRIVAQVLVLSVRPTDTVVRYGAGQLVVVLPTSNLTNACVVGERMRKAVSQSEALPLDPSMPHSLTLSVGVSEFQPSRDAQALIAAAAIALDLARTSGGDRVAMR
jgi:diguanylate cyclase (GGDEF)-like protein